MNLVKRYASVVFIALVARGSIPALASLPTWTKEDTERYWTSVAEYARKIPRRITPTPRSAGANEATGEGMLEAFGTKYMPNAYTLYQEKRTKAKEREASLKENFPKGYDSDTTGGALYYKIAGLLAKDISEMDRRHDELCYYYILHRTGVLSSEELESIDSSKICIMPPLEVEGCGYDSMRSQVDGTTRDTTEPAKKERTFALKYMPLTLVVYDKYRNVLSNGEKELLSLLSDANTMDAVDKNNAIFTLLLDRLFKIHASLNSIAQILKEKQLLHAAEEVTSEELARIDARMSQEKKHELEPYLSVRQFMRRFDLQRCSMDIAYKHGTIVGLEKCMVPIPGKDYAICKYEVAQGLWEYVMRTIPYKDSFKRADYPVKCVSSNDCQRFLAKLNDLPEVRKSGMFYRLPTVDEWMYAFRAGAKGMNYKIACDKENVYVYGDKTVLDEVAWCRQNADERPHPVGKKIPDALGLYDMIGNVQERTQTKSKGWSPEYICCGGDYDSNREEVSQEVSFRLYIQPWHCGESYLDRVGLRLVSVKAKSGSSTAGAVASDTDGKAVNGAAQNESEEVSRVRKAAEQGNAVAQNGLGYRYELGNGVTQNYAEALKWYRKAADQGNVFAQRSLGYYFLKGIVVAKDHAEAVKWFRKAAEQGHAQAQYDLGLRYANGEGVKKDEAEAVKWYRKAAAKGYNRAKMALERLDQVK